MNQRPRADNADQISGAVWGGAGPGAGSGAAIVTSWRFPVIPSMIVTILDTGSLDG